MSIRNDDDFNLSEIERRRRMREDEEREANQAPQTTQALGTLPDAEAEYLLDCLIEECAEVIQAATKVKRFGDRSVPGYGSNWEHLAVELDDVRAVAVLLHGAGPCPSSLERQATKCTRVRARLAEFLAHKKGGAK